MTHVEPHVFRQLLGRFATGVTVVTALDVTGEACGMTASSLAAVSLDPPLLLVCVDRAADFGPVLLGARVFAVNVLAADQEDLSRRFAAEKVDRFDGVAWSPGPAGVPLLANAVAHIVCEREQQVESGDHRVFFGRVTGGTGFDRPPLLHFRGRYTATSEDV